MQKILSLVFILLLNCFSVLAQDQVYGVVQQKARPREGIQVFLKQFMQEFNVDNGAAIPKSVQQISFRVKFIVEKDGSFSNIQVVDDVYHYEKEIKRVFNLMPFWNPAMHDGNLVRSSFTLPVKINYDSSNTSTEKIMFVNENQINSYLQSLNEQKIETNYFTLNCNCSIVKSAANDELHTEEYFIASQDDKVLYNIVFKDLPQNIAVEEVLKVKAEAQARQAEFKEITFLGYNALVVAFKTQTDEGESEFQTMFIPTEKHLVAVALQTTNKQLTRLTFNHLLKNFKLKN